MHDAAEMRAAGRMQMQLAFQVPARGDLLQSASHQAALSRPQTFDGGDLVGREVLREIIQRGDVLADVLTEVLVNFFATGAPHTRLIGTYDSQVAFGPSRVLLVWTRLIMPNGARLSYFRRLRSLHSS